MKALLECKTRDPYTEIGNYIEDYCVSKLGYYISLLATIEINGAEITEIFSFETDHFIWESDWWEGENGIKLLGFRPISDLKCYGLPEEDEEALPEKDELKELSNWIDQQLDTIWAAPLCYSNDDITNTYQSVLDKINEIMEERNEENKCSLL